MPEKVLGVLGGMGPAACAEFLRILARDAPAKDDSQHPKIIMLSDPETPDRSDGLMGLGPDPLPVIRKNLLQLAEWGADILAVPCNTAHYFIDRFRDEIPVPLVHIVEATVEAAKELSKGNCSWLLATDGTQKSLIYPSYAEKVHYHFAKPSEEQQQKIQSCVRYVKAGDMKTAGEVMRDVVSELWRERDIPVTMGCTELPLAYEASGLPLDHQVSSLKALSDACIKALYD
ncbi:MAG: aspartate/glutamate racemase family protein [Synergistaceae bacterium]|nr:aspartate/glutamate racemase family protein [Synergistaceae bacterium]MBR0095296.1 aspartate/glutamate racemase family protein [Synergistaceae bacterium]